MPQYSLKICTYDPTVIDAFDRLRKSRKQAAFTHEALKHFLATEKGEQVLSLMTGKSSVQFRESDHVSVPDVPRCVNLSAEQTGVMNNTAKNSSSVLDSILK